MKIKFRAWDKEEKKMYVPVYEAYKEKLFYLAINIYNGVLFARQMNGIFASKEIEDRFELMQYIGLEDSETKESYHKDIVAANGYSNWIIEWHNNGWKLKQIGIENYIEIPEDFIVIGNEFENPELMEAK